MTEKYFRLCVTADSSINELVVGFLSNVGAEGFVEEGNELSCYIAEDKWKPDYKTEVSDFLTRLRNEGRISTFAVDVSEVMNRDWNSIWEESIVPVEVTDNIVIKPSWKDYHGKAHIVVEIDPKMSFGTGHHETTRMMIKLLEKHIRRGDRVLDVGTGTGVLAIVAVKLGAESCVAVDKDEWSISNAHENVDRNGVGDRVKIIPGEITSLDEEKFDVVQANLNRNTLIYIKSEIAQKCKPGGLLMLSGILSLDESSVREEFGKIGYGVVDLLHELEWSAIVLRK